MMLTWVADVLRDAGLDVVELDGWRTRRTRSGFDPIGIVWHHTATPKTASDAAVDRLLRDGRSDLPGPLSQLGLRRSGTFVVVAAGRCNHNGFGTWGNDSIGIEAYNDGVGEPWPTAQVDAYVRGTAAICRHLSWTADRVKAHRETDPRRKVDPRGIDMAAARGRITAALRTTPQQEDDMADAIVWFSPGPHAYKVNGHFASHIKTLEDVKALKAYFNIPELNSADKPVAADDGTRFLNGPLKNHPTLNDLQRAPAAGVGADAVADELAERLARR